VFSALKFVLHILVIREKATAHGVCLLLSGYGTRSVPATFWLRHTECACYFLTFFVTIRGVYRTDGLEIELRMG
jgi:hypothetical protein